MTWTKGSSVAVQRVLWLRLSHGRHRLGLKSPQYRRCRTLERSLLQRPARTSVRIGAEGKCPSEKPTNNQASGSGEPANSFRLRPPRQFGQGGLVCSSSGTPGWPQSRRVVKTVVQATHGPSLLLLHPDLFHSANLGRKRKSRRYCPTLTHYGLREQWYTSQGTKNSRGYTFPSSLYSAKRFMASSARSK